MVSEGYIGMSTTTIEYRVVRKNGEPHPSEWIYPSFEKADSERIDCDVLLPGAAPHSVQMRVVSITDWTREPNLRELDIDANN